MAVDLSALWRDDTTEQELITCYQHLIDTGGAWHLEGHIGHTAMGLIEAGLCTLGSVAHEDYWGNRVPSKHEVMPGSMGSQEYVDARRHAHRAGGRETHRPT